jgi:hypothetical protein
LSRQLKLTPKVQSEIVALVEAGDAPEIAAGVHGIGRETHFGWMRRGITGEEPFAAYRTAITRARDVFESNMRACLLGGDDKGVSFGRAKAALEVLGRRFPSRWAQKIKHEIDESNRLVIEVLERVCSSQNVFDRVRQEGNCSAVFAVFCEEVAGIDSEDETSLDPGVGANIH